MLNIITHPSPDSTRFSNRDVKPYIQGDSLHLFSGRGTRRASWGYPEVLQKPIIMTDDFIVVWSYYRHKYGSRIFYTYILKTEAGWEYRTWRQLSREQQQAVMSNLSESSYPPGKMK